MQETKNSGANWTFLTNHGHVLVCLSNDGDQTLRTIALRIGITERAVQRIVSDLEAGGIITRQKEGRRNTYQVNGSVKLRHEMEAHKTVGDLLEMVAKDA